MKLKEFLKSYNLEKAREIEETKDRQFIALKKNWEKIDSITDIKKIETYKVNYLYMIIQTALISFQLSGKGEDWWTEVAVNISKDPSVLDNNENLDWWEKFIKNCKNNKRFIDMKLGRLKKLSIYKNQFDELYKDNFFYNDMIKLNKTLAKIMNQDLDSKTIVFAVKMFGYGARFILEKFIPYPFDLKIPVDSRIEKIYVNDSGNEKFTKQQVLEYFANISQSYNIPPLHLDGILWIEYWYNHIN